MAQQLTAQLTPPMGYNSWNGFKLNISSELLLKQAELMIERGLQQTGYRYFVVDDGWQHRRGFKPLSGNEQFGDMGLFLQKLQDMGFNSGIYTTPWAYSYGGLPGSKNYLKEDLKQFIDWGISFLKYDWNMMESEAFNYRTLEDINEMLYALNGEHIFLSIANSAPIKQADYISKRANMWRTTGDITDTPESIFGIGNYNLKWNKYQSSGRFNDPDMLVLGTIGLHDQPKAVQLTDQQQFDHFALWCFMGSPLFLGSDLTQIDQKTVNLLTDLTLLEINQNQDVTMPEIISKSNGVMTLKRNINNRSMMAQLDLNHNKFLIDL